MSKCVTCPRPVLVFAPGDAPSLWGQEESAVTKLSALSRPHAQERDGERTGISRLLCHDVLGDVECLTLLPGQAKVQCCFSLLSDLWHLTFHPPSPPAPSPLPLPLCPTLPWGTRCVLWMTGWYGENKLWRAVGIIDVLLRYADDSHVYIMSVVMYCTHSGGSRPSL